MFLTVHIFCWKHQIIFLFLPSPPHCLLSSLPFPPPPTSHRHPYPFSFIILSFRPRLCFFPGPDFLYPFSLPLSSLFSHFSPSPQLFYFLAIPDFLPINLAAINDQLLLVINNLNSSNQIICDFILSFHHCQRCLLCLHRPLLCFLICRLQTLLQFLQLTLTPKKKIFFENICKICLNLYKSTY